MTARAHPRAVADDVPVWAVELLAEMQALRLHVDCIESALDRLAPEPRISRPDRLALARLFPVLVDVFGSKPFTAADLLAWPALCAACPRMTLKDPVKSLGKFLRRVSGLSINGQRLMLCGEEGHANLWCVSTLGLSWVIDPFKAV
jgi:hypothetical protein